MSTVQRTPDRPQRLHPDDARRVLAAVDQLVAAAAQLARMEAGGAEHAPVLPHLRTQRAVAEARFVVLLEGLTDLEAPYTGC